MTAPHRLFYDEATLLEARNGKPIIVHAGTNGIAASQDWTARTNIPNSGYWDSNLQPQVYDLHEIAFKAMMLETFQHHYDKGPDGYGAPLVPVPGRGVAGLPTFTNGNPAFRIGIPAHAYRSLVNPDDRLFAVRYTYAQDAAYVLVVRATTVMAAIMGVVSFGGALELSSAQKAVMAGALVEITNMEYEDEEGPLTWSANM